jgi:hypothetical protein
MDQTSRVKKEVPTIWLAAKDRLALSEKTQADFDGPIKVSTARFPHGLPLKPGAVQNDYGVPIE